MLKTTPSRILLRCTTALLLLWALGVGYGSGQTLSPMSHQAWSTDEGLPASGVHAMLQSRDGYLWLATEAGAVRFDGYTFTTFREGNEPGFAGVDVSAIAEDTSGNLWFGTADGLTELRHGVFRKVTEADGFPKGAVQALAAPRDGSLLALTADGVWRFDGSRFSLLTTVPHGVTALSSAADGEVWLLAEAGVFRYAGGEVHSEPLAFAPKEPLMDFRKATDGTVWAWTPRAVFEAKNGVSREFRAGTELPTGRVTALQLDRRGTAWIGTNHGLFVLASGAGQTAVAVESLRGEAVAALLEDREGNVFVGTEGSGLHVLRARTFRSEPAAAGEAVTSVVTGTDGRVWFGTKGDGVHAISATGLQTPVAAAALTSPIVLSLARGTHGDVWVGTPDGLNHVQGSSVTQLTAATGLPDDFVRSVLVDAGGVVWAGTRRGLARIENGAIATLTTADGLGSDSIGPLLEVKDRGHERELWIGTSAGLSHLTGRTVHNFAPAQGSGEHAIVTALASDGRKGLWVGLHGAGLSHFQDGAFRHVAAASLPEEVLAVLLDARGYLWLRGTHAIYRVAQDSLLACAQRAAPCEAAVAVYNTVDGMPSDTLAGEGSPLAWQGDGGVLWFATRTGLGVANATNVTYNSTPPPVQVEHFRVDEKDVLLNDGAIRIAPGSNRYVFDFVALSFSAPSKNRYRYMLEGFDKDWIEAGAVRTASYTNLPPRNYVFRVQAANNDGVWNRDGASVRFRVMPPFYRRWWFYLLVLLLLSGLTLAIYRLRVLSIERRFALVLNERNRVAREVHDTLAQDFVSVSLQLDLASALLKGQRLEEAKAQLQETRKLVKDGLEEARQSIWNLRANTATNSLPTKLTELCNRYKDATFRVKLKMGGAYHALPAQIEAEVFRIAQESLSNVERHAQATEAAMELHYEPTLVRLTVRDNGQGFSTEEAERLQGHYGLRGMKERAAALHGTFTIQSELGRGTTVTLLVSPPEREGVRT